MQPLHCPISTLGKLALHDDLRSRFWRLPAVTLLSFSCRWGVSFSWPLQFVVVIFMTGHFCLGLGSWELGLGCSSGIVIMPIYT